MLIAKGAEAYLYREKWFGFEVIRKVRIKKKYRHPELDIEIRKKRTLMESKIMNEARKAGVPTPIVLNINPAEFTIIYEYVDGKKLKYVLEELTPKERKDVNRKIGINIGKLHMNNLIHGDLTTSNMILDERGIVYFIDFGLCEFSSKIEQKAVDLHLLKRALESTHYTIAEDTFKEIFKGYRRENRKEADSIYERIILIEKRGRYISER